MYVLAATTPLLAIRSMRSLSGACEQIAVAGGGPSRIRSVGYTPCCQAVNYIPSAEWSFIKQSQSQVDRPAVCAPFLFNNGGSCDSKVSLIQLESTYSELPVNGSRGLRTPRAMFNGSPNRESAACVVGAMGEPQGCGISHDRGLHYEKRWPIPVGYRHELPGRIFPSFVFTIRQSGAAIIRI